MTDETDTPEHGAAQQQDNLASGEHSPPTHTSTLTSLRPSRPNWPQSSKIGAWLLVVAVMVLAAASGFSGAWLENRNNNGLVTIGLNDKKQVVASQSQLINQIAKTVGPSVVSVNVAVTTSSSSGSSTGDGSFGNFDFSAPTQQRAAGTGIVIAPSGLIITNRHVVPSGTTSVSVTLSDGTELKNVSVLGRTSDSDSLDVAFLKVTDTKDHKLVPAAIGNSSIVQVGDAVVAIGNALGQFQNTVTSGIISGHGRSVQARDSSGAANSGENLDNLFQTDAAINEGNSGGPLVNLNGQVIGINTAIAGNAQNIGFAIPINDVRGLINQVLKTGKFERPYLGVRYVLLTADVADSYGLKAQNGAFVAPSNDPTQPAVIPGSPADKAGLQERDIITRVGSVKVDQTHSLISLLGQHVVGDKVRLTVLRGDKSLPIDVTLAAVPKS